MHGPSIQTQLRQMHARELYHEQQKHARDLFREKQGGPVDHTRRYAYNHETSYHHLNHPFWEHTVLHNTVVGPLPYDLSSGDDNRDIFHATQHNSFQPATYPLTSPGDDNFNGEIRDMPDYLFGFPTTSAERNRWYYNNNGAYVGLRQPHIYDEPLSQCNDAVEANLPGFDEERLFDSYYTKPQPQPTYSWNGL
jgi:hypothetical protein